MEVHSRENIESFVKKSVACGCPFFSTKNLLVYCIEIILLSVIGLKLLNTVLMEHINSGCRSSIII